MKKLMLEALAVWLALAAVSGQAFAAIQSGAKNDLLSLVVSRGEWVSNTDGTGIIAPPLVPHGSGLSSDPSTEVAWNAFLFSFLNPAAVPDGVAVPYPDEKAPASGSNRANAAVALLTSVATDGSGTLPRLTTGALAPAGSHFGAIDALQPNATRGFSLPGADDLPLGGKNGGYGTELKRQAILKQPDVLGASQGGFVWASVASGRIKAIRTVVDKGSEAPEFALAAGIKLVPETMVTVPEPGSWATLLAGLLGVIAIARRRMSL
jgi:hypothetical protein